MRALGDYLVLLSIYQTCKYMDVDFLQFLCSGENDIHAFAESRRRLLAGQTADEIAPALLSAARLAFDLLESGVGDYCTRRD